MSAVGAMRDLIRIAQAHNQQCQKSLLRYENMKVLRVIKSKS